jgi:O-acetyl-ADP-ribose deacetylase (regulator of RNase III)
MSITYVSAGNLLDSGADLLIVPVCCVPGVMGAGLARAFAERWPGLKKAHADAVTLGGLSPGGGFMVKLMEGDKLPSVGTPFGIYFLATKDHWRDPSRKEWVLNGLSTFGSTVLDNPIWRGGGGLMLSGLPEGVGIKSVAVPALGCGLGSLAWSDVRPIIVGYAELFPSIDWKIYLPGAEKGGGP